MFDSGITEDDRIGYSVVGLDNGTVIYGRVVGYGLTDSCICSN